MPIEKNKEQFSPGDKVKFVGPFPSPYYGFPVYCKIYTVSSVYNERGCITLVEEFNQELRLADRFEFVE